MVITASPCAIGVAVAVLGRPSRRRFGAAPLEGKWRQRRTVVVVVVVVVSRYGGGGCRHCAAVYGMYASWKNPFSCLGRGERRLVLHFLWEHRLGPWPMHEPNPHHCHRGHESKRLTRNARPFSRLGSKVWEANSWFARCL